MSDIVERLRGNAPKDCKNCLWCEAADEIERLRERIELLREWLEQSSIRLEQVERDWL